MGFKAMWLLVREWRAVGDSVVVHEAPSGGGPRPSVVHDIHILAERCKARFPFLSSVCFSTFEG